MTLRLVKKMDIRKLKNKDSWRTDLFQVSQRRIFNMLPEKRNILFKLEMASGFGFLA